MHILPYLQLEQQLYGVSLDSACLSAQIGLLKSESKPRMSDLQIHGHPRYCSSKNLGYQSLYHT